MNYLLCADYDYSESNEFGEMRSGVRVSHDTYGTGTIVRTEGRGKKAKVVVRFDDGEEKKFLLQYARFQMI